MFLFSHFFETLLIYYTGKFARHEINENIGVKYSRSERNYFFLIFLRCKCISSWICCVLSCCCFFPSHNGMFYNKRSLLFNIMPGSGRNFIMQLLFVPVSLCRISRLHPPFDGKGAFHGILKSWNFERCITRNEKFIKLVFPGVEIYAHRAAQAHTLYSAHPIRKVLL